MARPVASLSFNSRPHKEVDRRLAEYFIKYFPFNSRPHKEVDIGEFFGGVWENIFQFTTSQGGRLLL